MQYYSSDYGSGPRPYSIKSALSKLPINHLSQFNSCSYKNAYKHLKNSKIFSATPNRWWASPSLASLGVGWPSFTKDPKCDIRKHSMHLLYRSTVVEVCCVALAGWLALRCAVTLKYEVRQLSYPNLILHRVQWLARCVGLQF